MIRSSAVSRGKRNLNKIVVDGIEFPSRLEGNCWAVLRLLERGGVIRDLRRQVRHQQYGGPSGMTCLCLLGGAKAPAGFAKLRSVVPDFDYVVAETGKAETADAKGWLDPGGAQAVGYRLFRVIHGREIRLFKKVKDVGFETLTKAKI